MLSKIFKKTQNSWQTTLLLNCSFLKDLSMTIFYLVPKHFYPPIILLQRDSQFGYHPPKSHQKNRLPGIKNYSYTKLYSSTLIISDPCTKKKWAFLFPSSQYSLYRNTALGQQIISTFQTLIFLVSLTELRINIK